MNFLIMGDGAAGLLWAAAVSAHREHRLLAVYPPLDAEDDPEALLARPRDMDDALAVAGVEAVVVGGDPAFRAEALRRAAAEGLAVICLHPPGDDSEAYYQVALSREETGAAIVPDLSARLHPGVEVLRRALEGQELGAYRGLRYEAPVGPAGGDLARHAFARAVDVVRSLIGEIDAVNATGDPPGDRPDESLVVQLRGAQSRRAEVRLWAGPDKLSSLTLSGSEGSLTLEWPGAEPGPSRLVHLPAHGCESVEELGPWDPRGAVLDVLAAAVAGRKVHPDLLDGTRATEVAEGAVRSLRRGRTVELHYEEISEAGTFKSVMTSLGCLVLFAVLFTLPLALVGPAIGMPWTIYIAYVIPPLLIGFLFVQLLRFAVRGPKPEADRPDDPFRGRRT
jgi:myo-inositol 2-dehydrogenase/D-chiro-inositol 1-dehydrogenase